MTKPFRYAITPRGEVRLEMNGTTFFLNRRRAAELLRTIGAAVKEQGADSGPTAPEHKVIRTREELAALDPQTVLVTGGYADPWTVDEINTTSDTDWFLPVAVLATGDQVREAQQALKEKE